MAKTNQVVQSGVLLIQPTISGKLGMLVKTGKVGMASVTLAKDDMTFSLTASGKESRDIYDPVHWQIQGEGGKGAMPPKAPRPSFDSPPPPERQTKVTPGA